MASNSTVAELWREWTVGFYGQDSIEALERMWGSKWRPGGKNATAFCRRKVIIDAIRKSINRGRSEEEAVAAMEIKRGSRSLNAGERSRLSMLSGVTLKMEECISCI
jgi:hypothetical protein